MLLLLKLRQLFLVLVLVRNLHLTVRAVITLSSICPLMLDLLLTFDQQFSDLLLEHRSEHEVGHRDGVVLELIDRIGTLLDDVSYHFLGDALDDALGDQLQRLSRRDGLIDRVHCLSHDLPSDLTHNYLVDHLSTDQIHGHIPSVDF